MCEKRNIYSSVSSHWLMNWTIYCLDSCAFLAMTKDSHLQVERFSSSLKPTFKDGVMGKSVPAAQFELSLLWLWFKCSRSTLLFWSLRKLHREKTGSWGLSDKLGGLWVKKGRTGLEFAKWILVSWRVVLYKTGLVHRLLLDHNKLTTSLGRI